MFFYSTNKRSSRATFEEALLRGLAPDGGLYYPESIPRLSAEEVGRLEGSSLQGVGFGVLSKWIGDEVEDDALKAAVENALNFPISLKEVGPYRVLELFHGPSMAFKDVAAKCLAQLIQAFLKKRKRSATILVATSGDTGAAVAQGFAGLEDMRVVVLYPKGRVSSLQEELLTRVADNILPLEVEGVFDDCQTLVKKAFLDPDLSALRLTSANSINIGRLIPQTIYYVYAYALLPVGNLEFVVPSGNMGNVTAGLFAQGMGLPFPSFIIACNGNDSVVRYHGTGTYEPRTTVQTLSNAMDVGDPSNFVRILEYFDHNHDAFRKRTRAVKVDDSETAATIRSVFDRHDYLLDPHTAVGWRAAERTADSRFERVILATASPVKFSSEIQKTTGISVDASEVFDRLSHWKKRKLAIRNDYGDLKKILVSRV